MEDRPRERFPGGVPGDRVETSDPGAPAPLDMREADRLYQPFPDFASWKGLTEADLDLWDRFAKGLEAQRAAAPPEAFGRAVEVAMRAAAIDTGAIEGLYDVDRGFTMSVATQAVAWEHAVEERGADVRALFEAQLEAYELVLDAATKSRPVYEAWVRQLHEVLCRAQTTYRVLTPSGWQEHELVKGQYKTLPNHVDLKDGSVHAYAPVDRVPQEMHRLVEILTSPEFDAAHPVLQASYAHYALVNIHPFADGNGRVARALASLYFYRAVSMPLVIFANRRLAYFDALHSSDGGHLEPLIAFFRDRGIDTMQLVAESLSFSEVKAPEKIAADIASLLYPSGAQLDVIAARLLTKIRVQFLAEFNQLDQPQISAYATETNQGPGLKFNAVVSNKATVTDSGREFQVTFYTDPQAPFSFRLLARGAYENHIEIRLGDVFPEETAAFQLRLTNWIRLNLSQMLAELKLRAEHKLNLRKNP